MLNILSESETDVLAAEISGELTGDDYDKLRPELDTRSKATDGFSMIVEMQDVDGLDASTIRDDFRFATEYKDDIERLALVTTDSGWSTMTNLFGRPLSAILDIEIERFGNRTEAWKWIRSARSN